MALAALIAAPADALAHGHGHGRWGFGLGIGFGFPIYPAYPAYPAYVYPQPADVNPPPEGWRPVPAVPAPPALPEPIFYPREGQDAARTEADRQACNRWATTQRDALADARVFHRATLACMEGRGYTVR
jgi:hypothetical protein